MAHTSFPPELKARYLEMIGPEGPDGGLPRSKVCRELGITISAVRHAMGTDPDFAADVELALAHEVEEVEAALKEAAKDGSVKAMELFLTNRARDDWAVRSIVEHGKGGQEKPVQIAISVTNFWSQALTAPESGGGDRLMDFIDVEVLPDEPDELEAGKAKSFEITAG